MQEREKMRVMEQVANCLHDVVTDWVRVNREHGCTQETLCERIGWPLPTMNGVINCHRSCSVELLIAIVSVTGDQRPLECLAALSGQQPQRVTVASAMESAASSARSAGEAVSAQIQALADGILTPEERRDCLQKIAVAMEDFRRDVEVLSSLPSNLRPMREAM